MDWARDGIDWPNRAASRFVDAGGTRWHVQVAGTGPVMLLVHGTGSSTHSWRDVLPELATHFTVIAPDLPGHGFTSATRTSRMSIPGMASGLADLLRELRASPAIAVGHSAGVAILIWQTLDRMIEPAGLISFNGALLPIGGIAGRIFSPLAKVLSASNGLAHVFSRWAGEGATVDRLIAQTGSRLDDKGLAFYRRLAGNPIHAQAALAMMANWDLAALAARLPGLRTPLHLAVGTKDGSIPPGDADRIRRIVATATIERLRGLGHLAHEEAPEDAVALIGKQARAWGVIPQGAYCLTSP